MSQGRDGYRVVSLIIREGVGCSKLIYTSSLIIPHQRERRRAEQNEGMETREQKKQCNIPPFSNPKNPPLPQAQSTPSYPPYPPVSPSPQFPSYPSSLLPPRTLQKYLLLRTILLLLEILNSLFCDLLVGHLLSCLVQRMRKRESHAVDVHSEEEGRGR